MQMCPSQKKWKILVELIPRPLQNQKSRVPDLSMRIPCVRLLRLFVIDLATFLGSKEALSFWWKLKEK